MKESRKSEADLISAIVSVLFVHGEAIKLGKLAKVLGEEEAIVQEILNLKELKNLIKGLKIVQSGDEIQLVTDPRNADFVRRVVKNKEEEKLGQGSLEVLSIIAYQGPITKNDIELIRGVNSSQSIRNLMIKGLITEDSNKGIVRYVVTTKLLNALGVAEVQELPQFSSIKEDQQIKNLLSRGGEEMVDEE